MDISGFNTVDDTTQINFVAAINGYKWQSSWNFMRLLNTRKPFVTNLSTIFILGILIY